MGEKRQNREGSGLEAERGRGGKERGGKERGGRGGTGERKEVQEVFFL